jgi:DNA helicase-2/ATP-dependent DNA helicase PcrA
MKLTDKQKNIIATSGHLLVTGGPGSGKTTISILKAAKFAANELRPGQKVLFLSFARATVSRLVEAIDMNNGYHENKRTGLTSRRIMLSFGRSSGRMDIWSVCRENFSSSLRRMKQLHFQQSETATPTKPNFPVIRQPRRKNKKPLSSKGWRASKGELALICLHNTLVIF